MTNESTEQLKEQLSKGYVEIENLVVKSSFSGISIIKDMGAETQTMRLTVKQLQKLLNLAKFLKELEKSESSNSQCAWIADDILRTDKETNKEDFSYGIQSSRST